MNRRSVVMTPVGPKTHELLDDIESLLRSVHRDNIVYVNTRGVSKIKELRKILNMEDYIDPLERRRNRLLESLPECLKDRDLETSDNLTGEPEEVSFTEQSSMGVGSKKHTYEQERFKINPRMRDGIVDEGGITQKINKYGQKITIYKPTVSQVIFNVILVVSLIFNVLCLFWGK